MTTLSWTVDKIRDKLSTEFGGTPATNSILLRNSIGSSEKSVISTVNTAPNVNYIETLKTYSFYSPFSIYMSVKGGWKSANVVGLFDQPTSGLAILFMGNALYIARSNISNFVMDFDFVTRHDIANRDFVLGVEYDMSILYVYLDGKLVNSVYANLGNLYSNSIVPYGGVTTGINNASYRWMRVFNTELTEEQRKLVVRGGIPVELHDGFDIPLSIGNDISGNAGNNIIENSTSILEVVTSTNPTPGNNNLFLVKTGDTQGRVIKEGESVYVSMYIETLNSPNTVFLKLKGTGSTIYGELPAFTATGVFYSTLKLSQALFSGLDIPLSFVQPNTTGEHFKASFIRMGKRGLIFNYDEMSYNSSYTILDTTSNAIDGHILFSNNTITRVNHLARANNTTRYIKAIRSSVTPNPSYGTPVLASFSSADPAFSSIRPNDSIIFKEDGYGTVPAGLYPCENPICSDSGVVTQRFSSGLSTGGVSTTATSGILVVTSFNQ